MSRLEKRIAKVASSYLNVRLVFAMDLAISVMVSLLVVLCAPLFSGESSRLLALVWTISSFFASGIMFWLLRTYRLVIRHTSIRDVLRFALAVIGKSAIMMSVLAIFGLLDLGVWVMLFIDFLVTLTALIGVRALMILAYEIYKSRIREVQKCKRTLIYGTSEKAVAACNRLSNSKHFLVCGFISPDASLRGTSIADNRIYTFSSREDVEAILDKTSVATIIMPRDIDAQVESDRLVKFCNQLGVKTYIVPSIGEMTEEQINRVGAREIKIEDLLCRDEINISIDEVRRNFAGKTVMVTGAAGSIGSELCRQLAGFGVGKLVLFDNGETPMHNLRLELEERFPQLNFVPIIGDVRLLPRLDFAFRTHRPQIVFHAAAYKHVPLMEENPCEAVLVNVVGSRQVADKCIEYGVEKMVMISTDKAVNPTNIMGCSKRLAEIYVQSLGLAIERGEHEGKTKFVTTRFGNVLGSNGSVIPRFREQIAKGGPVTVTHPDIVRFFMTIPEACRLVMEAATMRTENRICVFDMGHPVKIDTLARRMIELSGFEPDKDIKVEYTGLRPGEKLYEEVLSNVENTEPTAHDRIRLAHVREYSYADALQDVIALEQLSRAVEIPDMVKLMKKIVPEYISNNSRFSEYDQKH